MANFEEDLDIFLNPDEFAIDVSLNSANFKANFDKPTIDTESFDASIEGDHWRITCKTSDIIAANISRRDLITVDGINYSVAQYRHDGTGISTVWLQTMLDD